MARLKRDYQRFLNGKKHYIFIDQNKFCVDWPEECFPSSWIGSAVPVIFDFRGNEFFENPNDIRNHLYCLFPRRIDGKAEVAVISRYFFINTAEWLSWVRNYMNNISQINKERQEQIAQRQQIQANLAFQRLTARYQKRNRRF